MMNKNTEQEMKKLSFELDEDEQRTVTGGCSCTCMSANGTQDIGSFGSWIGCAAACKKLGPNWSIESCT